MAYTSRQLIIDSYYLSGIEGISFETISGEEIDVGIRRLNAFIGVKGAQTKLIPYYDIRDYDFISGQEIYDIANLIQLDTLTFFLTNGTGTGTPVRLPVKSQTRFQYLGTARPENISAIPFSYYFQREKGGGQLRVYFLPEQPYKFQISGKYSLASVTLNQDLSTVYDEWYLEYMRYGLAIYLCQYYQAVPPASLVKEMGRLEKFNTTLTPLDLSYKGNSYFGKKGGMNWADVNYGKGWR